MWLWCSLCREIGASERSLEPAAAKRVAVQQQAQERALELALVHRENIFAQLGHAGSRELVVEVTSDSVQRSGYHFVYIYSLSQLFSALHG